MNNKRKHPHEARSVLRYARRLSLASLLLPLAWLAWTAPAQAQAKPGCRGAVLGVDGEPLPVGTQLRACVEWHPDPAAKTGHFAVGMQQALIGITLGEGGAFELAQEIPAPWRGHVGWLRIERETAKGARERYFGPVKTGELLRVQLQAEELLAAGTVRSDLGTPLRRHACRLGVAFKTPRRPDADQVLGARWELGDGVFRLYGFRAEGEFLLTSFYPYKGPSGPPVPLHFGAKDLPVVMPATGHLQVKVLVPNPFPQRALFAHLHDVERDKHIERWLIPGDATNIRLRPGRYQATIKLNGKAIGTPIECVVEPDKTCELPPLDLRERVHVYLIDVFDPEGNQIMPARVRVLGTKGMGAGRQFLDYQGFHWPIVIASTESKIDIEVSEFGTQFEKRILHGVDGNRRVRLQRRSVEPESQSGRPEPGKPVEPLANQQQPASLDQLDAFPEPTFRVAPKLTAELRKRLPATVQVLLVVGRTGGVEIARVHRSTDAAFDELALEAARKWRFAPATRKGKPVRFRVRVPIVFRRTKD